MPSNLVPLSCDNDSILKHRKLGLVTMEICFSDLRALEVQLIYSAEFERIPMQHLRALVCHHLSGSYQWFAYVLRNWTCKSHFPDLGTTRK